MKKNNTSRHIRICCVCGHDLAFHSKEEDWYRCNALDESGYQCECRLLKVIYKNKTDFSLSQRLKTNKEYREVFKVIKTLKGV